MYSIFSLLFVLDDGDGAPLAYGPEETGEDPALLAGLRAGDRAAVERLFAIYREPLYRFAWRYLREDEAARDVVQEVFVRLLQYRERLDPSRGVRALLFTTTLNLCYDALKRAECKRTTSLDGMADGGRDSFAARGHGPETQAVYAEMERTLARVVDDMPDRERRVLLLRKVAKMGDKEIAGLLGVSDRYVRKILEAALERVARAFDKAGYTRDGELVA